MEAKRSAWPGAVVMVAGIAATCAAMHTGHHWYSLWFGFVTLTGVGLYTVSANKSSDRPGQGE